jgi:hypothetical protein
MTFTQIKVKYLLMKLLDETNEFIIDDSSHSKKGFVIKGETETETFYITIKNNYKPLI